jgi:hypothetical protein
MKKRSLTGQVDSFSGSRRPWFCSVTEWGWASGNICDPRDRAKTTAGPSTSLGMTYLVEGVVDDMPLGKALG